MVVSQITSLVSSVTTAWIAKEIQSNSFVSVNGADGLQLLSEHGMLNQDAMEQFLALWDELPIDTFMADGGRYRYRRFMALSAFINAEGMQFEALPNRPFYQPPEYNPLNGGSERRYEPIDAQALKNPVFSAIFHMTSNIVNHLATPKQWEIELHPIRTICNAQMFGQPTPEGIHRDGVDYFFVFMFKRFNIEGGVSKIYDNHKKEIFEHTMSEPWEFIAIADRKIYHSVSPLVPSVKTLTGMRDVMVVNYRALA